MSDWVLVPCLVTLRGEFNAVAPARDKGADGSIGDSAHTSSSDHTPDEDSDILRDHDSDAKNEVHALDTDSSGPWPDGKGGGAGDWFDRQILAIVERHQNGEDDRLQYVIWRGRIANRSIGNYRWRTYTSKVGDLHFDHAHFSSRYTTAQEQDTSPWGVLEEEDMPLSTDKISLTADTAKEIGRKAGEEMTAATLLQLAVIYAARGDDKADAGLKVGAANSDAIAEIKKMLGMTPGATNAQVAAALKAALGDRALPVGTILAGGA